MKPYLVAVLAILIIGTAASMQAQAPTKLGAVIGPTYYAALYGVVGDDTNDQCSNLNYAMGVVAAVGPAFLELPRTGLTKIGSCNLDIPGGVILSCSGTQGALQPPTTTPMCGLDLDYDDLSGEAVIRCLGKTGGVDDRGECGFKDMYIVNSHNDRPFMKYTCGTPYLNNVQFMGRYSAAAPDPFHSNEKCAEGGMICPTNDGIIFGTAGAHGATCAYGDGFAGYGQGVMRDLWFSNMRQWVILNDNTNNLLFDGFGGDRTDAYIGVPGGSPIYIGSGSSNPAYGNHFTNTFFEMATSTTNICNYTLGAFHLGPLAQGNELNIQLNDMGSGGGQCAWQGTLDDTTAAYNDIHTYGTPGSSGCVNDPSGNGGNTITCENARTFTVRDLNTPHIGRTIPVNDVVFGAYPLGGLPLGPNTKTAWVSDSPDGTCNQTVLMLSGVVASMGMGTAVYSYSGSAGLAPAVGMTITTTGFVNEVNNVTETITAVSPGASVTVAYMAQVNESSATATGFTGGNGTTKVSCFYDGTAWKTMGNGFSPTFKVPALGDATAFSLLATGIVDGTMPVTVTTGSTTLGGTYKSGYTFNQGTASTVTYTLPGGTLAAGQRYFIANSNSGSGPSTSQLKLQPNTGQQIIFTNGVLTTLGITGYLQTSTGAGGDEICVVAITSSLWQVTGTPRGLWVRH